MLRTVKSLLEDDEISYLMFWNSICDDVPSLYSNGDDYDHYRIISEEDLRSDISNMILYPPYENAAKYLTWLENNTGAKDYAICGSMDNIIPLNTKQDVCDLLVTDEKDLMLEVELCLIFQMYDKKPDEIENILC